MKGLALLLCLNLLAANCLPRQNIGDLSKIMTLVAHYSDHVQTDSHKIGIIEFLHLHYADQDHQSSAEHKNFPFQDTQSNTAVTVFLIPTYQITFNVVEQVMVIKHCCFFNNQFLSQFSDSIWQPPKI